MEEKIVMFMMQQTYNEAALESLAELLLNKEQFDAFQLRKFELVEEKLNGMTDYIEKLKKEFE